MSIAAIKKQIEGLTKQKSLLERADELEVYLAAVDTLEIAVRVPPTGSPFRAITSRMCHRAHHDALPPPAQEIMRIHMREALQTAIRALRAEAASAVQ